VFAINRKFFFDNVRLTLFDGRLRQNQVDGLIAFLNEWETKHSKKDDRWLAYMLATTHHETDRKMQPIEEYGKGKGKKYGVPDPETRQVYFGRGFVQLTWKSNYEKMSKVVSKADLVHRPELALDLKNATQICFFGMMNGSFTGKKLGDYFSPQIEDWVNARRIINGTDKANLIASYAKTYYAAISYTTG
jgi:putative chitinase